LVIFLLFVPSFLSFVTLYVWSMYFFDPCLTAKMLPWISVENLDLDFWTKSEGLKLWELLEIN
jgi:hypothetical protein